MPSELTFLASLAPPLKENFTCVICLPASACSESPRSLPHAQPPKPAAVADEEWPDDATGPGAADSLSGMELIQRQLGGRVIEEIEDT